MAAVKLPPRPSGQLALGLIKLGLIACTLALVVTLGLVAGKVLGLVV